MSSATTRTTPRSHAPGAAETPSETPRPEPGRGPRTLDDLAYLEAPALADLYRRAGVPEPADLIGDLRGRMLAVPGSESVPFLFDALRRFSALPVFPWRGKSFLPGEGADRAEGVNRVISDRFRIYPFAACIRPSRAGAFDAVELDYDRPENPFFIRAIRDEVREVGPGLWLGQAYVRVLGRDRLVLYFGLARAR